MYFIFRKAEVGGALTLCKDQSPCISCADRGVRSILRDLEG